MTQRAYIFAAAVHAEGACAAWIVSSSKWIDHDDGPAQRAFNKCCRQ